MNLDELSEEQVSRIGDALAAALFLKKDSAGRWKTSWGTKTSLGLVRTVVSQLGELSARERSAEPSVVPAKLRSSILDLESVLNEIDQTHSWPAGLSGSEKDSLVSEGFVTEQDGDVLLTTLGELELEHPESES